MLSKLFPKYILSKKDNMIKVNIIFLGEELFYPICFSKLDSSWWSESDDTQKPVRLKEYTQVFLQNLLKLHDFSNRRYTSLF